MQLEAFLEWKQLEPVYWQWMVMNQTGFQGCSSLDSNMADHFQTPLPPKTDAANQLFNSI